MCILNIGEKKISESVELGKWQSVANLDEETKRYQLYTQAQLNRLEAKYSAIC